MLDLIKVEVSKLYKNKIVWIACLFFLYTITQNVMNEVKSSGNSSNIITARSNIGEENRKKSFLNGTYNKENYQELNTQYEVYDNKARNGTYTSKEQCSVSPTDYIHPEIEQAHFPNNKGNCERFKDAELSYASMILFTHLDGFIKFDEPYDISKPTEAEEYKSLLKTGMRTYVDFFKYSSKTADKLVDTITDEYKNHSYIYQFTSNSSLYFFTNGMQSRTMHYVTILLLVGLCSLFTKDRQYKVKEELLTTKLGRNNVVTARMCAATIYGISVFFLLTAYTFLLYALLFDLSIAEALIGFFQYGFPMHLMSIMQFTCMYTAIIFLCSITLSFFISMISTLFKHNYTSFLVSIFLLYCPVILLSFNMYIPYVRYSIMNTINTAPLMIKFSGIELLGYFVPSYIVIPCIYMVLIILCGFVIHRRELKTPGH